jgi:hypothetical protein
MFNHMAALVMWNNCDEPYPAIVMREGSVVSVSLLPLTMWMCT